ncbi:leucine-rich repeat domain-containing protein [Prevotella intermedia]|uniref:Leucine-rich repeat domain-containing protein n=1 Tax=Prevotella intermedia TaxID=28131 RepID=A0A3R7VW33_PREIN|nr:leucine-rich repeat domain-containing protein [Prevotella intermedia]RQE02782.1 leucine-rich repeat domain-containing protein [Prevotella intermedia]RRF86896.1 leucine-rich repeat domain-containing protein [Prevotella intermedia]
MKKIRFLLLALLLVAIPKSLWAYTKDQIVTFDNMTYKVLVAEGNTPTLMFLGTTKMRALVIPDKINDNQGTTFTVTEVAGDTRYTCKDITSVKLPETIVKLGNICFYDAKLTEINIPKSVSEIDHVVWAGVKVVPECKVDAANTHFDSDDNGVLYTEGKVELRSVPSNIAAKTSSDTYTVNQSVTSIAKGAFFSNPGLKKMILPPNLQEVEEGWPSIASTSQLEEFEMTPSSTAKYEVKEGVLFTKGPNKLVLYPHAKNVAEYTVPAGVKEMASYGIAGNGNMTSINLNEVTKVEISAIVDIAKLKTIKLPKDIKKAGLKQGAFERCNALEAYEVAEGNTDFSAVDGVLFSKNEEILYFYPLAKPNTSYTIPSTVKEIAAKSFQGATKLTSLVIPTSVEQIQEQAFRQNKKLASVTFCEPSKITNLSAYSFWQCTSLTEVTLPSSITEIGKVFLQCENLETVNVPANAKLKTIKEDAFATNKKLKNFNFQGNCNLEAIEANAFANAESLESFNFPKTVTKIERNAFTGCKSMATAMFAEDADIQKIGAGAFADCGLTSISIPKKVKTIEREAFRNCKALNKIDVTEFTTDISPEAFKYCDKLTDINVSKKNEVYSSVDGYLLSKDKKELLIFPPGKANSKFTLLPPSIEKIGKFAFYDCQALTNVTIPNKVTTIGERAFGLCKNLNTITFLCDAMINPNNINQLENTMSFDDGKQAPEMFKNITINVRKELFSQYNAQAFYKKFKGIGQSFTEGREEYIAVSDNAVDMLSTKREDHTFVLPTSIKHGDKTYKVSLIGDYAFEGVSDKVQEVVVRKDVEYIGAKAFITSRDKTKLESTVKSVFFIESNPTKEMLSTTRFELDETGTNYSEFAPTTKVYVKKSALDTYKEKWTKTVYNKNTDKEETSQFNFTSQIDYQIKDVKINHKYGTFAREFDVDFNIYSKENNTAKIGAFVAKLGEVKTGDGDYGHSTYHIRMSSVDVNGVGNHNYGYVPAYTGVLLKALDSETTPSDFYYAIGEDDDKNYTIANNIMHGVTVNPRNVGASTVDEVIYVMQKGIFKKAMASTVSLPVHKAYAKIEGMPAGSKVEFSFSDDNTTNAIVTVDAEEKNADNAYYNLNGQRVTNPQRGVFIKGGRKVIIK